MSVDIKSLINESFIIYKSIIETFIIESRSMDRKNRITEYKINRITKNRIMERFNMSSKKKNEDPKWNESNQRQ